MTETQKRGRGSSSEETNARILGWLSGLGLLVLPWLAAGVLATIATVLGPESWNAERTFPWFLLAGLVAGLGGILYVSVRSRGFRAGAVPGTAIALTVMAVVFVLLAVLPG